MPALVPHPPLLRAISSMATRQVLAELVETWTAQGGTPVALESVGGVDAAQRVAAGQPFDLVVLANDAIDKLAAAGHVVPGSKVDLLRSPVAMAVRRGAVRPSVDTLQALKGTLQGARAIGYSTGPSGTALRQLFQDWGMADTLRDRLVQAPPGEPVGSLLVRGEVEIGFQQRSELMHLDGVDLLGPMPEGAQIVTTFSAALCANSLQTALLHPLMEFLTSRRTDEVKRRHGMEPA